PHRHGRGHEAAALADADDAADPHAERPGVQFGAGAGGFQRRAAGLVVGLVGLADLEVRAIYLVGAAGDQGVDHLAQVGYVADLQVDRVLGLVAADAARLAVAAA